MDRDTIKKRLIKKYRNKLKSNVLEQHIDGLVDEYLENEKFVIEHGVDIDSLPNRLQMKYWFQDKLSQETLEKIYKKEDKLYEVNIDDIYIKINSDNTSKKDPLAEYIFKKLYNFEWHYKKELPNELKEILKIHKVAQIITNIDQKRFLDTRLANYAMLGTVRFYHLERYPYFNQNELNTIISQFRFILEVIYKVEKGFYGNENEIKGSIYLFDAFGKFKSDLNTNENKTNIPEKPKRKYTKRKQKDSQNGTEKL